MKSEARMKGKKIQFLEADAGIGGVEGVRGPTAACHWLRVNDSETKGANRNGLAYSFDPACKNT